MSEQAKCYDTDVELVCRTYSLLCIHYFQFVSKHSVCSLCALGILMGQHGCSKSECFDSEVGFLFGSKFLSPVVLFFMKLHQLYLIANYSLVGGYSLPHSMPSIKYGFQLCFTGSMMRR